jgi:Zn-dependent protease with chaperone function/tetratricopeptide (TPR) repeat protein
LPNHLSLFITLLTKGLSFMTDSQFPGMIAARTLPPEQPLAGPAHIRLVASATVVTLLFYLCCLLSLLFIGTVLLIDLTVAIAVTPFGFYGRLVEPMAMMSELGLRILRSLNIERRVDYALDLRHDDAPQLFVLVERLARNVGARPPDSIQLAMTANAWVRLRGFRRGRGLCTLGLGFDLLVTLSESELESVITHEMAHARLVQRGYNGWLFRSVSRMDRLTPSLEGLLRTSREMSQRFFTAELILALVSFLRRTAFRLAGSYSRQDEFAADAIAAAVCGSQNYRSALLRTDLAALVGSPVTWQDRLVQSQREESFCEWLRSRLTPRDDTERQELERQALNGDRAREFDTHPALADRLAALPENSLPVTSPSSALNLLKEPNALALRILTALEQIAGEQERKDTQLHRNWLRKQPGGRYHTTGQSVGLVMIAIGGFPTILASGALLADLLSGKPLFPAKGEFPMVAICGGITLLGVLALRLLARKERVLLPVPPWACWQAAMASAARAVPVGQWREPLEAQLKARMPAQVKGRKARARFWRDQCYQALRECHYQQALIAAQLCLEADPRSIEGRLGHAIGCAYFGYSKDSSRTISQVVEDHGLGLSVSWAVGWKLAIGEHWVPAETYLLDAAERRPDEPTLWSLLATCQWRLGKMQEAAQNARRAVTLEPGETHHRILLARILLAAGRPKEALRELEALPEPVARDEETLLALVTAHLLLGHLEEAKLRAAALEELRPGMETWLQLAHTGVEAHVDEWARDYLEKACRSGFCPPALVGLGEIEYRQRNYDQARAHLLSALDLTREPGLDTQGPLELLGVVCEGLAAMSEPIQGCGAWTAGIEMSASPAKVRRLSLLVHAPTLQAAQGLVLSLYEAMHSGQELPDSLVTWEPVPPADPSEAPVAPGIYQHWFE